MKAMIFSAGFGTRLQPITKNIPKALVRIKRRPILDWVIQFLIKSGVTGIVINTHYLADQISSFISDNSYSVPVTIIYESDILGTGGGLLNTKSHWDKDPFYICNVDILCDFDLHAFYRFHLKSEANISLVVNDIHRDSMLLVDQESRLCGWFKNGKEIIYREPAGRTIKKGFCGLHFFNPDMFEHMQIPSFDSIIEQYMRWVAAGYQIHTWSIDNQYWKDIGTPADLKQAEETFKGYRIYSPS